MSIPAVADPSLSATATDSAKICDACLTGSLMAGTPAGKMSAAADKLGDVDYYVTANELSAIDKTKVIVLACDIFGLGINNPKLIADELALKTGLVVYVPDLLEGDYPSDAKLAPAMITRPLAQESFFTRLAATAKMIGSFMVHVGPIFLYKHRPAVTVALATKFCAALRAEKGVKRIGMVGYCLGGVQTVLISSISPAAIDVLVVAHPGSLDVKDFDAIGQKPISLVCAEEDFTFDGIRDQVISLLEKKASSTALVFESKIYPGVVHGFACRPDMASPAGKAAFEGSFAQTADFFVEHL